MILNTKRRRSNKDKYPPLLGFIDLLLNLAVMFCFLFMLSQLLININKSNTSSADREGKYIVEAKWDDGVDADVDLWVKAPNGEISSFANRDRGTMSLLRDDLGNTNDKYVDEKGHEKINPLNHEEVTIRTTMPGEYLVNLHYFRAPEEPKNKITILVVIKTVKENVVIAQRSMKMQNTGQELTAFVFHMSSEGNLSGIKQPDRPILWVVTSSSVNGVSIP